MCYDGPFAFARAFRLVRRAMIRHTLANKAENNEKEHGADKKFTKLLDNDGGGIHSLTFMQLATIFCTEGAFETANGDTMEVLSKLWTMITELKKLKGGKDDRAPKRGKHG